MEKWGGEDGKPKKDYPIFMATSKKSGKDNSGEYVYRKDEKGNLVLDHDLDDVAKAFVRFAKEQKFNFWE